MLLNLFPQMLPLTLGGLLGWSGGGKLPRERAARQAAGSALERILPGPPAAALALRGVGVIEAVLGAGLLLAPLSTLPEFGAIVLGLCFACYLGYARAVAPGSSCGCSKRRARITWRSILRAGLVAAGGTGCIFAQAPWWSALAGHPATAVAVLAVTAGAFCLVSGEADQLWLLPLRRARLRVFGHPLAGPSGQVPVAATVELLERSLAWQAAAPIVRSALADHWDSDGWRILRYSGVHDGPGGPRPVSVVFALDAKATADTVRDPVVRVSVVDEEHQETLAAALPARA